MTIYPSSNFEKQIFEFSTATKEWSQAEECDIFVWGCPHCRGKLKVKVQNVTLPEEPFIFHCNHAGCHMVHNVQIRKEH